MKMFLVIAVSLVMITAAFATDPPAFGGYAAGWGQNPTNWETTSGAYDSGLCLWDPARGYVQFDANGVDLGAIVYEDITIELWVELHMISTYEATNYQFHRVNQDAYGGETVDFIINGTIRSNQQNWVGLTHGPDPIDALVFREGMYGHNETDIPLTWYGRFGDELVPDPLAPWTELTIDGNGDVGMTIVKCDHWVQFKGQFFLPYHIDDGYYSLTIAGCPTPGL
ncbi:hypothetical protein BMS3Bbin04_00675 [bacterium BMS3Bbin04]|nr:hypothetical protein BMS3Bbin04_00675 [bacterium BMS3Bbin04]